MAMKTFLLFLPTILLGAVYGYNQLPPPQTRGAELKAAAQRVAAIYESTNRNIQETCQILGVNYRLVDSIAGHPYALGVMSHKTNTISVLKDVPSNRINQVNFHEIGHFIFHGESQNKGASDWQEPEADSFAWMVCEELNLPYDRFHSQSQY